MNAPVVPRVLRCGSYIDIKKTTTEKVGLTAEQMISITIDTLSRVYDIPYGPSIKDGKLLSTGEVSAGPHSYTETNVWRDATEMDRTILSIINQLKSLPKP